MYFGKTQLLCNLLWWYILSLRITFIITFEIFVNCQIWQICQICKICTIWIDTKLLLSTKHLPTGKRLLSTKDLVTTKSLISAKSWPTRKSFIDENLSDMTEMSSSNNFGQWKLTTLKPNEINDSIWNLTIYDGNMFQTVVVNGCFLTIIIRLICAKIWCAVFKN